MEHIAIDLGRPNSVLCELDAEGKKVFRRFRLDRPNLIRLFSGRPPEPGVDRVENGRAGCGCSS
jgi:hypothetical protein